MFAISFFVLLILVERTSSYASYYASKQYCNVMLAEGRIIMGSAVKLGNSRNVVVKRGGVMLTNGDAYTYGETLTVSLTETDVQYAYQVMSGLARFNDGACDNTRIANRAEVSMTMPNAGDVILFAGT